MYSYRESRNLEKSLIDWLQDILLKRDWKNVRVEKVFKDVYKTKDNEGNVKLPAILVNVISTETRNLQIGSSKHHNDYTIYFRIFGDNDGQRLDLTDFLLEELEEDIDYYQFTISQGEIVNKNAVGKIAVLRITRNEKEFVNTEAVEKEDRYRQLLAIQVYIAK